MTLLAAEVFDGWGGFLVLAGLIALVFALGRLIKRHAGGHASGAGAERGDGAGPVSERSVDRAEARLREKAEAMMAEIESFGREVRGQAETRVRILSELVARADAAVAGLQGLEGDAGPLASGSAGARLNAGPARGAGQEGTGRPAAGGEGSARGSAQASPRPGFPPPEFGEVYRLADEGLDPAHIAERTEFERGEVELILGLRGLRDSMASRASRAPSTTTEHFTAEDAEDAENSTKHGNGGMT